MTHEEIISTYKSLCHLLEKKQVKEFLDKIEELVYAVLIWQLLDKAKELKETYHWMLNYSVDGVDDPEQKKVYNILISNCFKLAEDVKEELLSINSHDYIYSQKRFFPHTKKVYAHGLGFELEKVETETSLHETVETTQPNPEGKLPLIQKHEELSNQLFKQCWLAAHYTDEESQLFTEVVSNENIADVDKALAIASISLSLFRFFDEDKLVFLIEQCNSSNELVAQRALVGLLPVLAKYDSRLSFFPNIRNRLVILFDNGKTAQHVLRIILQFARTNETEKITKKLQEEILPEMMKVAPKIREKIDMESLNKNEDSDEKNPEWEEMLENSGIADKLKEFSDLQMEGADVYMSTFAMLKNFGFFHDIANWFRPFDAHHSELFELFKNGDNAFLSAMMNNSYMCNSDRYSFCLSLLQMPESQREMMSKAFTTEAEQMRDMQKEENILLKGKTAEFISNGYIQDLYRFYNLFTYKDDFENPFHYSLRMHHTWFFDLLGFEYEEISQIAEYYFRKNFFKQALELFRELEKTTEKTSELYQKIGYCYQQMGYIKEALKNYLHADIISPNNKWTIRKIAFCYKQLKEYDKALEFYLKAQELYPNNENLMMQIGNCYLNNKQYNEALSYYFKVEYDSNENVKIWRAIAWTSFLAGKLEQSDKYYTKIIEFQAQWIDFLNAGHSAWAIGDRKKAVSLYKRALEINNNDIESFIKSFSEDISYLTDKNIDSTEVSIILDYLRYYTENQKK